MKTTNQMFADNWKYFVTAVITAIVTFYSVKESTSNEIAVLKTQQTFNERNISYLMSQNELLIRLAANYESLSKEVTKNREDILDELRTMQGSLERLYSIQKTNR